MKDVDFEFKELDLSVSDEAQSNRMLANMLK